MAVTTVAQFAAELNRPAATLLEQLHSAGVAKASSEDVLTEVDKERLLDHLRSAHGTAAGDRKKITLTRKSTTEIKQADASGKARTIQVEVRKKRVFVKRDEPGVGAEDAAAKQAAEDAELARREEEASQQAEQLRLQEEQLAEERRQREEEARLKQEAAERAAAEAAERAAQEKAEREAAEAAKAAQAGSAPAAEPAAPVEAAPVAPASAPVVEAKPAVRVVKAADIEAEEKNRLAELGKRRKAAEDEAAAIRAMMSAPKKVLTAKKPEEEKPKAEAIKGTIHKPKAGAPGAAAAAPGAAKLGDKKAVKSEKLSSSWADDAAKKRAAGGLKTRNDAPAGAARNGWRAPSKGGRKGDRNDRGDSSSSFVAPTEPQIYEVHVPETISVADLAHKMSVKASEVIKQMMKLGQMVTINQQLDQETAMIVVEEMGHKALAAKLDDPEAFLEETEEHQSEAMSRAPVVTVMSASTSRPRRSRRASSKCTCPRPSPWLSWRTRWPSRRARSSRR